MNAAERKQAYYYTLSEAQKAIKRGDKLAARRWTTRAAQIAPRQEEAWLLLAAIASPRASVAYLERALEINPASLRARKGMDWAIARLHEESAQETVPIQVGDVATPLAVHTPEQITPPPTDQIKHKVHDKSATPAKQQKILHLPYVNGPLILGLIIVTLVGWLAIKGPEMAPKDPNERTSQLRIEGQWLTTPFPPSTPGYPLGSDGDGRDMLSRILWGFQPTMTMVMIVASVRLFLGTLIGLGAGWSQGRTGRVLDSFISTALAIPVIMVALGGIAAVGVDLGIWAFVFGLSLTGWVETARLVRERTAAIRGQVYIEAAQSLGAGNFQLLMRHVMRQVISMLWMLFAFEVSSTLMLTATLGFLGYYIGGDVWVQVEDAFAEATSGTPELGQMLATTESILTRPWPLLMIGAVVFITVLGFNLLGEGLRRRASHTVPRGRSFLAELTGKVTLWVEDRILWPLSNLARTRVFRVGGAIALIAVIGYTGWPTIREQYFAEPPPPPVTFDAPIWATQYGDSTGTRYTPAIGPQTGQIAWTFTGSEGFAGGPVIGQDGTVYATGTGGMLYALNPAGGLIWRTRLPTKPAAGPALSANGDILIGDIAGGLAALSPTGRLIWHVDSGNQVSATANPVVGNEGITYYPTGSVLQAVSGEGTPLWATNASPPGGGLSPVLLSSSLIFFETVTLDPEDGSLQNLLPVLEVDQFIIGADGQTYYRKGNDVFPWTLTSGTLSADSPVAWEHEKFSTGRPQTSGVTPEGMIWMFYSSFARGWGYGEDTRIVWLDQQGGVHGNLNYPTRNSAPIAVDSKNTLYSCGNLDQGYGAMECQAFAFGAEEPLWTLGLEGFEMAGGALAPGRLYVTTTDGYLHAIGDTEAIMPPSPVDSASGAASEGETIPETTVLEPDGEPLIPAVSEPRLIFSDELGFSGAPVHANGNLFVATTRGELFALSSDGKIIWQVKLLANAIGAPVLDRETLYVTDKTGLTAFTLDGKQIWRFEHEKGATVGGPTAGPDGAIYYTIEITSKGHIQAVSPQGAPLWLTRVKTFGYYRSPILTPNGQFVFFRGEVYDTLDGSAVDLGLEVTPDELIAGEDGNMYIRLQDTIARWTFTGGQAVLSEARIITTFSNPIAAGVTAEGGVWIANRSGVEWFTTDGTAIGTSEFEAFFTHVIGLDSSLTIYSCGRDRSDFRQSAKLYCAALPINAEEPLWGVVMGEDLEQVAGGVFLPDMLIIATEEGRLYSIKKQ